MVVKSLNVSIELENDAFCASGGSLNLDAIARVLHDSACKIYSGRISGPLMDTNGNTVGSFELRGT